MTDISDVITTAEWHRNGLHCSYFRPYGVEHELSVSLSHPPDQTHVLLFDRGPATVRTHFRNIFSRLGVHSRHAALVAAADQL